MAANDLTTLASVKTWLGSSASTNNSADGLLGLLITSTSADFLRAIERTDLLSTQYTERRTGDGSRRLVLRHWPVTAIGTLTVAGATVPQQGGTTDGWYLDSGADPERAYVLYLSGALAFTDAATVTIGYTAGYTAIPADIGQAVTEWVQFRYIRKSAAGQTQVRGVEGETAHFEEFSIPPNTQRVIAAYKRKFAAYGTDNADSGIGSEGSMLPQKGTRGMTR